jgi:hypothetical protein
VGATGWSCVGRRSRSLQGPLDAVEARQVERASGVSEVAVEGTILRCLVCGGFQPFIEALGGHEVVDLTSVPTDSPGHHTPAAAPRSGGGDDM